MLEAIDLGVAREGSALLQGVSATFPLGRITAICGPNGAGKSTLLQALAGLEQPSSGMVTLSGQPLADWPARSRAHAIGYLPQNGEVAWNLSVEALVALGRLPHGDNAREPVAQAIRAMDLSGMEQRRFDTLSGGEKARALLARVLAGRPNVILADEPLAALDLAQQLSMLRHLRAAADAGAAVVMVLHDLSLAMNHADNVLVLHEGRVHEKGPPEAALQEAVIRQVWQVPARWEGESGARALLLI